jgi:hypothetical protein
MDPLLANAPSDVRAELERLRAENARLRGSSEPNSPLPTQPGAEPEPEVLDQSFGAQFERWVVSVKGMAVKGSLLAIVLVIYAGVPEIVSWSRYVDVGLTGRYYTDDVKDPVFARVDRQVDLHGKSWPAIDGKFNVAWSGYIEVPDIEGLELDLEVIGQKGASAELLIDGSPPEKFSGHGLFPFVAEVKGLGADDAGASSVKLVQWVGTEEHKVVPALWLHLDQEETPEYKGKPYMDATPTVFTKFWLVFPCGVFLAWLSGGKEEVHTCFRSDVLWAMLPCGFLFSIADVSEILANGGIDPTTYIVLSQARLLLTALVMKWRVGQGQTQLQWMDLMVLTVLVIVFQLMPNDLAAGKPKGAQVKDNEMLGIMMTVSKVLLSVYAGVAQQKAMKSIKVSFVAQVTAQQVGGIPAILLALPLCCMARGTPLSQYGFYGGPDGGWDHRTWGVVMAYSIKIYLVSLCVKKFDALIKNICNAGACLLTYFWATGVTHRVPGLHIPMEDGSVRTNAAAIIKLFLILAIIMVVGTYSMAGGYQPKPAKPKAVKKPEAKSVELVSK